MSSCFIKILYALALLLLHFAGFIDGFNLEKNAEIKCIEMERQALFKFMQGLHDRTGMMLSTWRDGGDCCKWKGIECNPQTGHLQRLDLRGHYPQFLIGVINFTSLIELQEMEYLDLSYNDFSSSRISELVGLFTNLRYLNLSYSYFGGRIPSTLGELTHLTSLDLSSNNLHGEIPRQLGNLSQLQYLALEGNSLSGAIPFQIGNLPLLHTLSLDGVTTINAEWLSTLSSLTNLDLSGSFLDSGSSRNCLQAINKLIPNLIELRLAGFGLSDNDTASLFHSHDSNSSTSLTILDLSSNMLKSSSFQFLSNFRLNNLQELYLSNNSIVLPYPLYANFPSLVILDLSYNNLSSSKFQGNFNFGSSKLQQLRLFNCSLMDASFHVSSSVAIVNSSSSLVVLDLSSNLLRSSDVFYWIFNFTTNLRTLNVAGNLLEGPILDGFGKVMNSLEVLDLSGNKLQHEIPTFFGNMCTLKSLDLSYNNLSGEISNFIQNSSWCNRHIFRRLDLSSNQITGMIPQSIRLLSELEFLNLGRNYLEGDVTESHLTNFSKLQFLFLSYNSLLSPKLSSSWIPPFQLASLGLASCKLGLSFPNWIRTQRSLQDLDISDAGLNGTIPEWLWNISQYIDLMDMSHNNFIGTIPNLPFRLLFKPSIYLDSNQLEGAIPSFLLQASELFLSRNKFSNLFTFLCDKGPPTANLATLDLSNNQIKGQLPDCWKSVNTLLFLDLRNNELSGKIPDSMGSLVKLEALVLQNNSLKGELPATLKNCGNLMLLDVGENLLSGPVPSWIGENLQQLIMLRMKGNRFSGNIPKNLCYLRHIQLLDLSGNKLSKEIPTCIKNFTAMSKKSVNSSEILSQIYWRNYTYYDIYGNNAYGRYQLNVTMMWKGMEYGIKNPELRMIIDLSNNNLTGEIPKEVGYLQGLTSLNLSTNNLSGEIPFEIGNLSSLESLDLSRNHFFGHIPSSLPQVDNLAKLNLSYNSLSGRIPQGRHFQTFDASSFEGNPDLCGEVQLNKSCPGDETIEMPQGPTIHGENNNSDFYQSLYMSLGLGYFIGFWGLIGPILLWRPWRIAYGRFLKRLEDYIYVMVVVNMARWRR